MTELDTVIVSMVSKLDAINQKVQLASGSSLEVPQFFWEDWSAFAHQAIILSIGG